MARGLDQVHLLSMFSTVVVSESIFSYRSPENFFLLSKTSIDRIAHPENLLIV